VKRFHAIGLPEGAANAPNLPVAAGVQVSFFRLLGCSGCTPHGLGRDAHLEGAWQHEIGSRKQTPLQSFLFGRDQHS
jgi:hypothetical protein